MANNVVITDSGVVVFGSALAIPQTDNFFNFGTGNTITGEGGNINVTGLMTDSNTAVVLNSLSGAITGVSDTFTLNGSKNSLTDTTLTTGSTINFKVLGNGGTNSVNVTDASSSTVNVAIGVDPSATAPAGHNNVHIINAYGTNNISLGGPSNTVNTVWAIGSTNTVFAGGPGSSVTLDGMATNTVTFGAGAASATIGFKDDDHFGFTSTVTFAGAGNTLNGGDENFTVSGSTGSSTVHVGDGENSITMGGAGNTVSVWGGDNWINAGGGGSHVTILGLDGTGAAKPTDSDAPPPDDGPVPLSPTDWVTISGAGDSVSATYENVNIWGTAISGATVTLGNGNNSVVLSGAPGGGNHVTVGNGGNAINVTGNSNTITVGNGANGITLSGNGNVVTVNDPTGIGNDIVQLGAGTGDAVALGHAAGSVTGFGTGTTTVTQSGPNAVTVNLNGGTGHITLGDGNDTVTANGGGTTVKAGNGNDTVTANGAGDTITLGNGANTVAANGGGDTITLGNGANTVTANGGGDTLTLGNGANTVTANGGGDKFTFGNGANSLIANGNGDIGTFGTPGLGGNNTLFASGSGDVWTFNENAASTVTVTQMGSIGMLGDTLNQTGGALNATAWGHNNTLNLTNVKTLGTTINSNGNLANFDLTNSGGVLNLNPATSGDFLTVNGVANNYHQSLTITNLTTVSKVDLEDLYNPGGTHIGSFSSFLSDLTPTGTGDVLHLQGGGSITFAATTAFKASQFAFS